MAITRKQVESITVIAARGRFYGDKETDELEAAIMAEAATGNTRLVVNLSEAEAMNSVALGVLMRGFANYRTRSGEMKLCGLGKKLKDLFVMTKLIMVFDHHDTEEAALASFADVAQ
ncbi:MAG: STAS domain-containing protein [Candidatus Eisenbacteria bacterium]|uniref:STAS domain-containing protein n=1 Tax=Eiseniibacteriota bacterium TaxID=2212470 RepID=A0A933WA40_UNCEI|nr:STAS domain-containing protein [Candidatus Eisenbacteria bacterium]